MEKTNIADSGKFRESLSDLANTSNPFALFFKIWGLFGVLADEIAGVVEEIGKLLDNAEKSHIYSLVYDVLPEKEKDIAPYVQKIGGSGDTGHVMTFSEWKKRDIRIRRGVLSEYPDILDSNKTDELTKFRLVRDYFARTQDKLTNLDISSKTPGKIEFNLSIHRKNAIRSRFQIEDTEKFILDTPANVQNDPRLSFKLRIESSNDADAQKEIVQEYIEWKASQMIAKELKDLTEDVVFKVQGVEAKGGITNRSSVGAIIAVTDSMMSPAFLPFVTNRLAKKLNGRLTIAQVRQYAYLISNIRAYSYDEYLSVNKFFRQLEIAMDKDNRRMANASRYGFWLGLLIISAIAFPTAVTLSFLALVIGFIVSDFEIVRRRLMHLNLGLTAVFAFLLIVFSVFGTLVTKGDFFTIKYHEYRYVVNQLVLKNVPELVSGWKIFPSAMKTSTLEYRGESVESGGVPDQFATIDPEFLETCYRLNYVIEKKSCFDK